MNRLTQEVLTANAVTLRRRGGTILERMSRTSNPAADSLSYNVTMSRYDPAPATAAANLDLAPTPKRKHARTLAEVHHSREDELHLDACSRFAFMQLDGTAAVNP